MRKLLIIQKTKLDLENFPKIVERENLFITKIITSKYFKDVREYNFDFDSDHSDYYKKSYLNLTLTPFIPKK